MGKPIRDPRNARGRRTREAVLAATREILETEGFEALTMAAVAVRAGITRQAIYLHFRSRAELVTALFGYVAEQEGLQESLAPIWDAPDAVSALGEWARHLSEYHPRLLAMQHAIGRVVHLDPDAARHRETVMKAQLDNCDRLARWLADEDRLAEPWTVTTATDMLWGLISTDLFERLLVHRSWTAEQTCEYLRVLFESTFVRPPLRTTPSRRRS